jgi:RHS repeat-associated protein
VSNSFIYDSFGNVTSSTGSFSQPFRFTGREWDSETGLYFYRARYYDSQPGRFISEDSWKFLAGPNFYSYVANDPVGQIDPSGHQQTHPAPGYDPAPWNDPAHVHTNNCYSYACDRLHPPGPDNKPQPGEVAGIPLPSTINCVVLKALAKADGLKDSDHSYCPCGTHDVTDYHRVKLYFTSNFQGSGFPDYHWYRQDSNGMWSSKHGWEKVGPQIANPDIDARSWGYDHPCGTMCAPNK